MLACAHPAAALQFHIVLSIRYTCSRQSKRSGGINQCNFSNVPLLHPTSRLYETYPPFENQPCLLTALIVIAMVVVIVTLRITMTVNVNLFDDNTIDVA